MGQYRVLVSLVHQKNVVKLFQSQIRFSSHNFIAKARNIKVHKREFIDIFCTTQDSVFISTHTETDLH